MAIVTGCCSAPDASFSPGLLSVESMNRISHATDPLTTVDPYLRLSPSQLHHVLGRPDQIFTNKYGCVDHHYYRDSVDFAFSFRESQMTSYGHSPMEKFSAPHMTAAHHVKTNPFSDLSATNIAYVEFTGNASPIRGPYCIIRDRETIDDLFALAGTMTNENAFIPMCGNLTGVEFYDRNERLLAFFTVNTDGVTISVYDGEGFSDKRIMAKRRDIALACFELLRQHALEVLLEIAQSNDKCIQETLWRNFPFEELLKQGTHPSPPPRR